MAIYEKSTIACGLNPRMAAQRVPTVVVSRAAAAGRVLHQANVATNKMTSFMANTGTRKTSTIITRTSPKAKIRKTLVTRSSGNTTTRKVKIFTRPTSTSRVHETSGEENQRRSGRTMIHSTGRRSMVRRQGMATRVDSAPLTTTISGAVTSSLRMAVAALKEDRAAISITSGPRSRQREADTRIPTSIRSRGSDIEHRRMVRGGPNARPSTADTSQMKALRSTGRIESLRIGMFAAPGMRS